MTCTYSTDITRNRGGSMATRKMDILVPTDGETITDEEIQRLADKHDRGEDEEIMGDLSESVLERIHLPDEVGTHQAIDRALNADLAKAIEDDREAVGEHLASLEGEEPEVLTG